MYRHTWKEARRVISGKPSKSEISGSIHCTGLTGHLRHLLKTPRASDYEGCLADLELDLEAETNLLEQGRADLKALKEGKTNLAPLLSVLLKAACQRESR